MQVLKQVRENLSPREMYDLLAQIQRVINGGIEVANSNSPTVNVQGALFTGTSPGVANTEFTLTHNFGFIPTGWWLLSIDKPSILYKGVTAWSTKTVSLKFDQATVAYKIFLL